MPDASVAPQPEGHVDTRPGASGIGSTSDPDATDAARSINSLARNGLAVMATTGVNASTGYLFWVVATIALSVEDLGRASSAIAAVGLVTLLADLGLTTTIVADLPGRTDRARFLTLVFVAGLLASLVGSVIAVMVLRNAVDDLSAMMTGTGMAAFTAAVVGMTLGRYCDQVAIADRRAHLMLARNAAFAIGKLGVFAALAFTAADRGTGAPIAVVIVWGLAAVVSVIGIASWLRLGIGRTYRLAAGDRRLVVDSAAHHAGNLGGEIPMFLLPLVVLARAGAESAGVFYVAWMVASIVFTVSAAMSASFLAEARHEPHAIPDLTRRTMRIIGLMLGFGVAGTVMLGKPVLGLFGEEFSVAGYELLVVLLLSAVPDGVTNVWVSRWRALGRHRRAAVLNIAMAVIAIGFSWWRVPIDGIVAVGFAWVLSQSAGCALIVGLEIHHRLRPRPATPSTSVFTPHNSTAADLSAISEGTA